MTSRRYVKRVWRVPKDRGALEYFAALVVKALRKHGWPADWRLDPVTEGFVLVQKGGADAPPFEVNADTDSHYSLPPDMLAASEIAVRIVARTYRVDVSQHGGWVGFNRRYRVAAGGHFREEK